MDRNGNGQIKAGEWFSRRDGYANLSSGGSGTNAGVSVVVSSPPDPARAAVERDVARTVESVLQADRPACAPPWLLEDLPATAINII